MIPPPRPSTKAFFIGLLAALSIPAGAADFYMTPLGSGAMTGTSYSDAFPFSQIATRLNSTMLAGDTLHLGSGTYAGSIGITTSGASGNLKRIVGEDTGSGVPVLDRGSWSRTNPESGGTALSFSGSAGYWEVANLKIIDAHIAVSSASSASPHVGIIMRDITMQNVRHGLYLYDCDNLLVEGCTVKQYSKHGFRLEKGCDNVTFDNCIADLSDGDDTWWDYSENFPFGFNVNDGGTANTNITFQNCTAANNRENDQRDSSGNPLSYWNGDGFVIEGNTAGVTFLNCVAFNNEDAGFDIKPAATFIDCVSVKNYRGYRCWDTLKTITNCAATYPFRRSAGNPTGSTSGSGIWVQDGSAVVDYFTFHSDGATGVDETGTGFATLSNSILSFSGANGVFKTNSVNLANSSVTYRPGAGTDPSFVAPSPLWNGIGTDMDSQFYTILKGYSSTDQTAAYEGESLTVATYNCPNAPTNLAQAQASGGYYAYLNATGTGQSVTYNVNIPTAGDYDITLRVRRYDNRGICQASIDGVNQGSTFDLYTPVPGDYTDVHLGAKSFATAGTKAFKFTITGKNPSSTKYGFAVDYIELSPSTAPSAGGTFEAELLARTSSGATPTGIGDSLASGGAWSNLPAVAAGNWIEFTVPNVAPGTYQVQVKDKTYTARGIYQLSVNGTNVGSPVDQYLATATYRTITLGTITVSATGDQTFRFTVTGKNAASTAYTLSVDSIILTP